MNSRTEIIKKNIIYSFILKMISILLSFFLIPITVNYLTVVEYGIWIVLFSIMSWINFLDFGLGLGLRNKLAEAVSKNDIWEIKTNLSTGIISIIGVGCIAFSIFLIFINYINMQLMFNTKEIDEQELYISTFFAGLFIIISFILSIINQIYYAYQKAAITGVIQIINSLIMLVLVYYLTVKNIHGLLYFVISFGISMLFSRLIFAIHFFYTHKELIPSFKFFRKNILKKMFNLGAAFFIIQICSLIVSSTSSFFITQILGPQYVREYDITFKLFSFITMAHTLICTPLWSAYTDAFVKKDYGWIMRIIKKLIWLMIPICIISLLLMISAKYIIELWIGHNIDISNGLVIVMGLYVITNCWMNIWSYFLNGIGNIKIQMYVYVFSTIICIPLGCYLMKYIGNIGMILGITLDISIIGIVLFFQSKYILKSMKINEWSGEE